MGVLLQFLNQNTELFAFYFYVYLRPVSFVKEMFAPSLSQYLFDTLLISYQLLCRLWWLAIPVSP